MVLQGCVLPWMKHLSVFDHLSLHHRQEQSDMAVAAACKEMCDIILCLCNIFISMENVLLQYIFISICIYLYIYVLAVILSDMRLVT